jgi:hypothetical protein
MGVINIASTRRKIGFPQQDNNFSERFILSGGLNIEQPQSDGDAGSLIYCQNFEPNFAGGYITKGGFEPVDGQRQPSAFYYIAYKVSAIIGAAGAKPTSPFVIINDGIHFCAFLGFETIAGQLYIIATAVLPSFVTADWRAPGAGAPSDLAPFNPGATINSTIGPFAILANTFDYMQSLDNVGLAGQYISRSRDYARSLIKPVGGSSGTGRACGVFDINGQLYAIRNNGSTDSFGDIWRSSGASWVIVPRSTIVFFQNLTTDINEGDVLTNVAGTITMTVNRVIIQFGTTGTGDACGYFMSNNIAGAGAPWGNAQVIRRAGAAVASTPTAGAVQTTFRLPRDGSGGVTPPTNYRFRRWNFSGKPPNITGGGQRIYGVSAQGPAFEFDGTTTTPILTGLGLTALVWNVSAPSQERPTHLAVQADHLFLGYDGGGLQHSGLQTPLNWTAVQGADTRQTGDDIENLVENVNGTLMVQTRTRTGQIYGDVNENFQLRWNDAEAGGYAYTAAKLTGAALFLTDQGVMVQSQSNDFGNFSSLSQSSLVNGLLRALMRDGAGVTEATISRERSMYRLYFDSGKCLSICIVGDKCLGIGYCDYGLTPHNFWSGPSTVSTGGANQPPERILFCSDSGFVYQDDSGGSFGGSFIVGKCQTQFYRGQDNQALEKRYRQMFVDVLGADAYTNLKFSAEYDDGADYRTIEQPENITRYLAGGQYQAYSAYNQAFYGPSNKNVVRKQLGGQGVGVSFIFTFSSNISLPFTIQAIEFVAALRSRRGLR